MPPKVVIFDLDDTLVIEAATARKSMRRTAAILEGVDPDATAEVFLSAARDVWQRGPFFARCLDLAISSWEGLWATFEGNHESLEGLRAWAPTYRAEAWRACVERIGVHDDALAGRLAEAFIDFQREGHPMIEGAAALLDTLAGDVRLGLLTNGPSDIQRWKIAHAGLDGRFGAVVVSGEMGIGKPDPRVFREVLNRLGVRPEDAVMVGDSWERDIRGAVGVGLRAVWMANGREAPAELEGVAVATTLREAGELVLG